MTHEITVADLLRELQAAAGRMGAKNPSRALLARCASAVAQLADRVAGLEARVAPGQFDTSASDPALLRELRRQGIVKPARGDMDILNR